MNSKQTTPSQPIFRDCYESEHFEGRLAHALYSTLLDKLDNYDLIVVCIGTDRSTGDSLGPLIGTKLSEFSQDLFKIYGTLDHPVHAINLVETINHIQNNYENPYILAIDACLGDMKNVGAVTLNGGSLKPGAAVQKSLPSVGHSHITGIVNVGGFMEFFVLQNTRLSVVVKMADKISRSIQFAAIRLARQKGSQLINRLPSEFR